jgi:hypothetical protein
MRRGQGRVQGIRPKQERAAHELRVLVWGGNFAEMVIGERTLAVHNLFAVALLGLLPRCSYVAPSPQIM